MQYNATDIVYGQKIQNVERMRKHIDLKQTFYQKLLNKSKCE